MQLPLARTAYAENIYWVYGLVLDDEVPFDAEEAMRGLGTGHRHPAVLLADARTAGVPEDGVVCGGAHPVAERLARRGFYIPSGMALTEFKWNG